MKKLSKKHIAHMQKMLSDRETREARFQTAWGDCIAGSLREMSKREITTLSAVLRYIAQQGESTDAS